MAHPRGIPATSRPYVQLQEPQAVPTERAGLDPYPSN
jgi:hypothetical protein